MPRRSDDDDDARGPSPRAGGVEAGPGTYALVLAVREPRQARVGRLGPVGFRAGIYVYVGSARGPGGVRARLRRHCGTGNSTHWHIDCLRPLGAPLGAFVRHGSARLECEWARRLSEVAGLERFAPGFGASDCGCAGHLLHGAPARGWHALTTQARQALGAMRVLDARALRGLVGAQPR